jgi:hypothetical protein
VGENLGHLGEPQLGVGGEAHLEREERRGDPEAGDQPLGGLHLTAARRAPAPDHRRSAASRILHPAGVSSLFTFM